MPLALEPTIQIRQYTPQSGTHDRDWNVPAQCYPNGDRSGTEFVRMSVHTPSLQDILEKVWLCVQPRVFAL